MVTRYISAIKQNETDTHINAVRVHDIFPPNSDGITWLREQVIKALDAGDLFTTIYKQNNVWEIGQSVLPFEKDKTKYIRTIPNKKDEDNLGDLPQLK